MIKRILKSVLDVQTRARLRLLFLDFKRLFIKNKIISSYSYSILNEKYANVFFGYYDVTPFSADEKSLLYLCLKDNQETIDIKMYDIALKNNKTLAQSHAWNWQQGCRLRWFPGKENCIIFNDADESKYYSRILNIKTHQETYLSFPLYDIDRNGMKGITTDFTRLGNKRPGYGFTLFPMGDVNKDTACIDIINISNNTVESSLTYGIVMQALGISDDKLENCYVNHLSFSPSGNKFMFFFIEVQDDYHQANMLVYDLTTKVLHVVEDQRKVSHYVWENDDSIIATSYERNFKCNYYRYSVDERNKPQVIMKDVLIFDGHPSLLKNGLLLTDTYPDNDCFQTLYTIDEAGNKISTLMKLYSTPHFSGERRTDLHPRISPSNNYISIDTNVDGHRSMLLIKY